ncbi:MAG: hypothetical protein LIP01_12900 [Tannerellaceae bacterium]|nr:hypothetical protein [Tannerellaceae bacterium]
MTDEGALRNATLILDKMQLEGVEKDLYTISRNNNYRISVTVGADAITASLVDWKDENIEVEF